MDELQTGFLEKACAIGDLDAAKLALERGAKVWRGRGWLLHDAVRSGNTELVRLLYDHGADLDARSSHYLGKTPLHIATEAGNVQLALLLTENHASVDIQDDYKKTPLHIAAEKNYENLASVLLTMGATVTILDDEGWDPAHYAAQRGNLRILEDLRKNGYDLLTVDGDKTSLLHLAAEEGHLEAMKFLIRHGASPEQKDRHGFTPLDRAKRSNHSMVAAMLQRKSYIDSLTGSQEPDGDRQEVVRCAARGLIRRLREVLQKDPALAHVPSNDYQDHGRAPLHLAAFNGHKDVMEELLRYQADVNMEDKMGVSPLHLAARNGHISLLRRLVNRGATLEARDKKGRTAVHHAATWGRIEALDELWHLGCDLYAKDISNCTALHHAADSGHKDIVEWLLKQGLSLTVKNERNETAEDCARKKNRKDVVAALYTASKSEPASPSAYDGSDRTMGERGSKSHLGSSTANYTDSHSNHHLGSSSRSHNGADSRSQKGQGNTVQEELSIRTPKPGHPLAPPSEYDGSDRTMGERGSKGHLNPSAANYADWHSNHHRGSSSRSHTGQGNTAQELSMSNRLLEAAAKGNTEEVLWCIKAGADLEATGIPPAEELRPLHLACRNGHTTTVTSLLQHKANVHAKAKGMQAVHYAACSGDVEILDALVYHGCDLNASMNDNSTALHLAVLGNHQRAVRWLVEHGAETNKFNNRGETPCDVARKSQSRIYPYLDKISRETQLLEVSSSGDVEILRLLLETKLDLSVTCQSKEHKGWQPLHLATDEGHTEVVRALLDAGANPEATTPDKLLPVHLAVQGGRTTLTRLLIGKMKQQKQHPVLEGKYLVHWAAIGGHISVLECLVHLQHSLHALTHDDQQNILHLAATYGNLEAVKWMVDQGVRLDQCDRNGYLPYDCAMEEGQFTVAEFLKQKAAPAERQQAQAEYNDAHYRNNQQHGKWQEVGLNKNGKSRRKRSRNRISASNVPQGLVSLGNTCYINAVLQCLYNTCDLTTYFLNSAWKTNLNQRSEYESKVAEAYYWVVHALHSKEDTRNAVRHFKATIGSFDETFRGNEQREAHDLLSFLLHALDKELQQGDGTSYLARLFYGKHISTITCMNKKIELESTEEPFSNLAFPVHTRDNSNSSCSLKELLESYYREHSIQWDCFKCGIPHMCRRITRIKELPQVLVIHLSRYNERHFDARKKKVEFPSRLGDMNNYIVPQSSTQTYNLYGVCHHQGTTTSGHYTATCWNRNKKSWYFYNDESVTEKSSLASISNGAHILFYESINLQD